MSSLVPMGLYVLCGLFLPSVRSFPTPDIHGSSSASSDPMDLSDYYLPPPRPQPHCASDSYPPAPSGVPIVRWFVVDLDAPPEKRWGHVIKQFIKPLKGLTAHLDEILTEEIRFRLGSYFPIKFFFWLLGKALPVPIYAELEGMAQAAAQEGIDLNSLVSLNIFYELTTACTSIVARKPGDGRLIHGRNLDFGFGLGTNPISNQFVVSEYLRNLTINVHFKRSGETLYSATTYAGYVTILNGVKKGKFSMSLNQRETESAESAVKSIFSWVLGMRTGFPLAVVTRRLFEEEADSYVEAERYLESVPLLSPVYFILGGASGVDAAVITRSLDRSILPTTLASANQSWILQTNYDHWTPAPEWDDRRTPANHCMGEAAARNSSSTSKTTSLATLFDVLSTKPVLNLGTTYTSLMDVNSGKIETFVRTCRYPCSAGPASFQGWT